MKTNIPIYRAKKIDNDKWVKGYLTNEFWTGVDQRWYTIYNVKKEKSYRIDPNTLAIHFPNMIDKNGKKIFASLSEDGVGGDIVRPKYKNANIRKITRDIVVYNENKISILSKDVDMKSWISLPSKYREIDRGQVFIESVEVIGIHKG